MALINRMSRLFTADVHAVLDRLEEPGALLKQAIREMEEELARSEQRVTLLEHERARLSDRRRKLETASGEIAAQLDVAFGSGNDELARKVVKRKLETERLAAHVAERNVAVEKALAERTQAVAEQREHLDVLRQKAEVLGETPPAHGADDWTKSELAVRDDEVELAFLRERQRRTRS